MKKYFSFMLAFAIAVALQNNAKATNDISRGTFSSDVSEYVTNKNMVVKKGNVYLSAEDSENVAKIGNYGYKTVQAAIDAANDEATIVLIKDTSEDIVIKKGKNITLDLNGKTLTNISSDTITVELGGKLTVTGEGTVDNKTHAKAAIFNNGEVVLNGGVYDRTSETGESADISGGNSWYTICNHGTMTINENTTVNNTGSYSSMIENGYQNYNSSNQRTGYVANVNSANPSLKIQGGTFIGGLNTVKNDDGGLLTIEGGTYRNTTQASILNWNEATIAGGNFECDATHCVLNGATSSGTSNINSGILTITGGIFKSSGTTIYNYFTSDDIISVSGGTYLTNHMADESVNKFIVEDSNLKVNPETGEVGTYYTVTFDNNVEAQYIKPQNKVVKPSLVKDGYTVVWYNGDKVWDFDNDVVVGDMTLTARFVLIEYKLTYHVGEDGKQDNVAAYNIETEDIQLKAPMRKGYTFEGWYNDENYTGSQVTVIKKGSMGDRELYAKWKKDEVVPGIPEDEKKTMTITYAIVIDGERIDVTEYGWDIEDFQHEVEKGASISQEELDILKEKYSDFDIAEYKFKGIYLDIVGKEEVKGNILFNEDTTLYLIWESSNPLNPSEPIVSTKPVEEVTDNPEKVEETVNVIKDVVKTNDNNSVLLYANVCALTIVGVTIIVLMKKKEDLMNR